MDKKLLVAGVSILALGLGACAEKVAELPITTPYIKYKTQQVKQAVSIVPDWFKEMPEKKGSIFTVGASTAPDLQLAVDVATLNAKVTLADRINGKLDSMTKQFVAKMGTNDIDASVLTEIEKVSKNVIASVDVAGYKVKEIKNETISTYDGLYPSFEIIYEGKQPQVNIAQLEITLGIDKYTGLKKNKDYWIGISWEE